MIGATGIWIRKNKNKSGRRTTRVRVVGTTMAPGYVVVTWVRRHRPVYEIVPLKNLKLESAS